MGPMTPTDALQKCKSVTTGGLSWRLPTMLELASIEDHTLSNPAIDRNVFPDTPSVFFMSSSPGTKDTVPGTGQKLDTYGIFDFKDGTGDRTDVPTGEVKYVRCVKTGL
jgi:hypothetical protein